MIAKHILGALLVNTRIEYLYRDGENYKIFHEEVVEGELTIEELKPYYYEGGFFVPSAVGLTDLQEQPYRDCDHVWHEITAVIPTDEDPTLSIRDEV